MLQDRRTPIPRMFFREVRNGNLEKASELLAQIIDSHLARYHYNEENLTVYISAHLILTLDLCGYLEIADVPVEPLIQREVRRFPEYSSQPDATTQLATKVLQLVGTFSLIDPFHQQGPSGVALANDSHSGLIRTVCGYLDSYYLDPDISVSIVAEHFGLSVSYLSRLFYKDTGVKLGDYILMLKFHEAKRLLRTTQLSITAIAERCGFSSGSAFIRSYRAKEGMTPGAYRRQLQFDTKGNYDV